MKKIGLLGGTFDPIHNGHIILGKNAFEQCGLDEVWLMVSPDPPHKLNKVITPFEHRFKMVELAAEDYAYMKPSDYEVKLAEPSYTVRTLKAVREEFPDTEFYFVVASDSLYDIETWYKPEEILKLTTLVVGRRNPGERERSFDEEVDYIEHKYGAGICTIDYARTDYESYDISSTEIRERVRNGEPITGMVDAKVEEYILKNHLYVM